MTVPPGFGKEFLSEKEIQSLQDNRGIDKRIKIYMEAAALRLKVAEERLTGKESAPGDPLEFFTPEDMIDGYYRILKSVEHNLDDAANMNAAALARERKLAEDCPSCGTGVPTSETLGKALKNLKSETEKDTVQLLILKKIAEEKQKEELWKLVNDALDITKEAHEGAEYGLIKHPAPAEKEKKKK
jgi:hypothetical protein